MNMNVYNIVWADDEIDDILTEYVVDDLKNAGISIIGIAHDGRELESVLSDIANIDAIIVDANFNETSKPIESERDKSGLDYARSLYIHKLNRSIPMFIYTNRTEEMLRDMFRDNPAFFEDFPRHKRWFSKNSQNEQDEMINAIKKEVDERKTTAFVIRNRYREELNAAYLNEEIYVFVYDFLIREYDNTLSEMDEPFIKVRRSLEKMFSICEKWNIIPPVSEDMNGTANYFFYKQYSKKEGKVYVKEYEMLNKTIMPMPLARSLKYIVDIVQDGAHSKDGLKLDVDKYFKKTKDTFLLRSVVHILIDCLRWFALTILNYQDEEINALSLWEKIEK